MRLPVSFSVSLAVAAAALCGGSFIQAQSSSSTQPPAPQTTPTPAAQTTGNGTYISTDPLANVRYDNRYDVSLGMAYGHLKAGPTLLQGANLGGVDFEGSYWLTRHLGIEGTGRAYLGTSGAGVNDLNIKGPFVSQYLFAGGAELLGPHNKHGAITVHAMFGGAYGNFTQDLRGNPPSSVDFYNNQIAPAAILGGHFDLNRSAHWVFRVTPDALFTRYGFDFPTNPPISSPRTNWNFGLSVGVEYKFKKKR
jgi:hypothetical protein